jgi:uncharacterized protein YhfF
VADRLNRYWQQFLASLAVGTDPPTGFVEPAVFGFTREDATEISKLVLEGVKTATGSVLWSYQADGKALPRTGDFWIVVDGDHNPVCVIRTSSVEVIPYSQVGEEYAHWGGEGDRTLESWRRIYWQYIGQECERIGRQPSTDAPLIMERFEVVFSDPPMSD